MATGKGVSVGVGGLGVFVGVAVVTVSAGGDWVWVGSDAVDVAAGGRVPQARTMIVVRDKNTIQFINDLFSINHTPK